MFRYRPKYLLRIVALALAAVLALSACEDPPGGGSGSSSGSGGSSDSGSGSGSVIVTLPQIGPYEVVYDANLCQIYRGPGLPDLQGLYCAEPHPSIPLAYNFYFERGYVKGVSQPVFIQEYQPANADYDVQWYYPNGIWTRTLKSNSLVLEMCWVDASNNCQWVSISAYKALAAQQLQQQQAAAAQKQASDTAAAQAANAAAVQAELNKFKETEIRIGMIWTQPSCNFSSNGCR